MERIATGVSGANPTSWQTNVFLPAQNITMATGYQQRTFGSPGAAASSASTLPGLKINEIGVSSASNDFVEIFNPTGSSIDLASAQLFLQRDSSCDLTNGVTEVLALSGTIAAGGYYVIANSGHSLANVNSTAVLGNIGSGYCLVLTSTNIPISAATNSFIVDWVTIAGSGTAEGGSRAPDTGSNGAISRMPNGADTNLNAADFLLRGASPGAINGSPTFTSNPANAASGVAITQNVVLTFSETMNTGAGTVTLTGSSSGTQSSLPCAWSMTTVANDTCTVTHANFTNNGETVVVSLNSFISQAYSLGPTTTSFSFTAVNTALTPTVTNVVVTATTPNNGTTPYNTGTSNVTITGTNFTGATAVNLDDLNGAGAALNTALTSVSVVTATQITATVPAGIRTNGNTGWNVRVTTPSGTNTTSTVLFIPRAGILISEVVQNGANGAANEFVELYNATTLPIDIGASGINLRMHMRSSGGVNTNKTLTTITGAARSDAGCTTNDTTIPSHGFYLIVSTSSTAETWWAKRNMTFANGITGTGGVYISLSSTTDLLVIDRVGWGGVPAGSYEGTDAGTLGASNSIERKPASGAGHATDTDNNSADFNAQSTALTPRYCLDAAQP